MCIMLTMGKEPYRAVTERINDVQQTPLLTWERTTSSKSRKTFEKGFQEWVEIERAVNRLKIRTLS